LPNPNTNIYPPELAITSMNVYSPELAITLMGPEMYRKGVFDGTALSVQREFAGSWCNFISACLCHLGTVCLQSDLTSYSNMGVVS